MKKVILIRSETLGHGDDELGHILMRSFLTTLGQEEVVPENIFLVNGAVKLACTGSPVLGELRSIEARGAQIKSCVTCLGFFNIKHAVEVGEAGTMKDTVDALLASEDCIVI